MRPEVPGEKPRVLMVAYHFPPLAGSSGIQRTLRFVQHLPALGWETMVLTTQARAYERVSADLDADVPPNAVVQRAFALDTARHLSIAGRYPGRLARPDRWMTWRLDGTRRGMAMIEMHAPRLIWSTFPIPTAHVIGAELQRRSGLPWIADFRDPMVQPDYPACAALRAAFARIEAEVVRRASFVVVTSPSALRAFQVRYPEAAGRIRMIENGYDEESFAAVADHKRNALNAGALTFVHSGIVYESERDPTQLMVALRRLHDAGRIRPGRLKVRFRASQAEALLERLAREHGVLAYVELCAPVPYRQALAEMLDADGLLLMQAENCNMQVPAKFYEYLRAARPVLGLVHPAGDTALALERAGITQRANLHDADDIVRLFTLFLSTPSVPAGFTSDPERRAGASRRARGLELVELMDRLGGPRAGR